MSGAPPKTQPPGRQLIGMLLLARGHREGLAYFRNDTDAVVAAIAPWVAMWLVAALLSAIAHRGTAMLPVMALSACSMLAPPVLTELLARLWRRRELWPRFAAATFWCEWLMVPVYALSLLVASILIEAGLSSAVATGAFLLLAGLYWLWLHWFIARHGLRIGGVRAGVLVGTLVAVMLLLGSAANVLLPQLRSPLVPHVEVQDSTADAPGADASGAPAPADKTPAQPKGGQDWQL